MTLEHNDTEPKKELSKAQAALFEAIRYNELDGVKKAIVDGADPKDDNSDALFRAATFGYEQCVEFLIPLSDPKAEKSKSLLAAARSGSLKCVELLIPVSTPKDSDSDALMLAAQYGHLSCIKALIPVSDPKSCSSAALRKAVQNGHWECARTLLPVSDGLIAREFMFVFEKKNIEFLDSILEEAQLKKYQSETINKKSPVL